jgi:Ca2+-binding EF-hand superfamily protein
MDMISHKQSMLKEVFAMMDTRNTKRIDGMELYTIFLFVAKADYESVLKCAVDVFGIEEVGVITKGELFFFIDSLFRGLSKFLIVKEEVKPSKVNTRLDCQEISNLINKLVPNKGISKNDIYE